MSLRASRLDQITAVLAPQLPTLSGAQLRELVDRAARGRALAGFQDHLDQHPDALTSGDARVPLSWFRFLVEVKALGVQDVVVPLCADCGNRRQIRKARPDGARICQRCDQRARARRCYRCEQIAPVATRTPQGDLCQHCYQHDPTRRERCTTCGKARPVASRRDDGSPLCSNCYDRPTRLCIRCGEDRRVKANTSDGPVCGRCHERPQRTCGSCGRIGPIAARVTAENPDLCHRCYRSPIAICSACRRERPCIGIRTGRLLCRSCIPQPQVTCAVCRRRRPVAARWPRGPVCSTCYEQIRSNPAECPSCGRLRPLIGIDTQGRLRCGPCSGVDLTYACGTCGTSDDLYRDGECARCVLGHELREHLGGPGSPLAPLVDVLKTAEHPASVLRWLHRKSSSAGLLRQLLAAGYQLDHELLDTFPDRQAATHLRHLLIHVGILTSRDEHLART